MSQPKVFVVMPAYNAVKTIERTYADIPREWVQEVIVVDDASRDQTAAVASRLGVQVIVHRQNYGYGANQKTCYSEALRQGADIVVMVHADHQYDPTRIPQILAPIIEQKADMMLGSRISDGQALRGGMPLWKFIANRCLTTLENLILGQKLSDLHTGFRAYSRGFLEQVPWFMNSDDFVFDTEMIVQGVACGFKLAETPVPARYFDEASSVNFKVSTRYGLLTLAVLGRYLLHKTKIKSSAQFMRVTNSRWQEEVISDRYEHYSTHTPLSQS
jgi:glycosyltransferase involved in cell wall biosynthesis